GVDIEARLQIHQIEPLALKLRDVTRGREELKIEEELTDD
ncbi:IMPACT family protein, partial [Acinetobacter sp. A11]